MKIGGIDIQGPNEEVLVLPRLNGPNIVIRARAVTNLDEFNNLCPMPQPPGIRTAKEGHKLDYDDAEYQKQMGLYSSKQNAYMILKSLEPSEIEWDNIKFTDHSTWLSWEDELRGSGFSTYEIHLVVQCVLQANSLDETKLKKAREVFLLGQGTA